MRKGFLLSAVCCCCALVLSSCTEKFDGGSGDRAGVCVGFSWDVTAEVTKGLPETAESLQLFVFDESGSLECYVSRTGLADINLLLRPGMKDVYALYGAHDMVVSNRAAFLSATWALPDDVTMFEGHALGAEVAEGLRLNLPLRRTVSCVKLDAVTFAGAPGFSHLRLRSAYLTNAVGAVDLHGMKLIWRNRMKWEPSVADGCLYGAIGKNLTEGLSWKDGLNFYCYPNDCTATTSRGPWSERVTRLVVETEDLDRGRVMYYSIDLGALERNYIYEVSDIMISREGTSDPDIPVITDSGVSFSVTVQPWTAGHSFDEVQ